MQRPAIAAAWPHIAVPATGSGATFCVKSVAKMNVVITAGKADDAQS